MADDIPEFGTMGELSPRQLFKMQEMCADRVAEWKDKAGEIAGEIAKRFAESGKRALDQAGKEHGTLTMGLQDGVKAKVDVKKTVSWDSEKLMGVAQAMPWDRAKALFKIDFEMSETLYKGVAAADPDLKEAIDKARTVKLSEPKVVLEMDA